MSSEKFHVFIVYYGGRKGNLEVNRRTFWEEASALQHRHDFLSAAAANCHPILSATLVPAE